MTTDSRPVQATTGLLKQAKAALKPGTEVESR